MEQDLTPVVQELLKRVEALEAELGVLRTLYRYSQGLDDGLEHEWVELFTEDAVLETYRGGKQTRREVGHGDLTRLIAARENPPAKYHKHLQTVPLIHIQGDEATTQVYEVRVTGSAHGPYLANFGRYRDHLVKDGTRWRIKQRRVYVESEGAE